LSAKKLDLAGNSAERLEELEWKNISEKKVDR